MITLFVSHDHLNGLVQERCNSIANALELRLSCTNPSILFWKFESLFLERYRYKPGMSFVSNSEKYHYVTGLILGLCPDNERRRYKVTPSLIGWVQT